MDRIGLCSGHGQFHSVDNKKFPQAYITISISEIKTLIKSPPSMEKEKAQWVIFSTLRSRVFQEQNKKGLFYALWADIDDTQGKTFTEIVSQTQEAIPEADFLAYTSRSATKENQKLRLIFELSDPVSGHQFGIFQKILNDKLEAASIIPDRATERHGQLCYLPNRGEFYKSHILEGFTCKLSIPEWDKEILQEQQRLETEEKSRKELREQARLKAAERMAAGCKSPIDAYNADYPLPVMLATYGYSKRGNRWLSPNSESGNPGVTITSDGQKWLSSHGSDSKIGRATDSGTMGDVFDLFVYYEHNGDRNAAIKAAGQMFTLGGLTLTKYNQKEYMQAQEPEAEFNKERASFCLDAFVMNDFAEEMDAQMLDDKFVLGSMAILGQSTVFYAKPNAGKTLLTLWLIIQTIQSGEINGNDVFYINADDTHRGLVFKLKLAKEHGFKMMAPGYLDFRADQLPELLRVMINSDSARGKILILDTVKKFTDLMKKSKSSAFGEQVRQFVSHGGTVVMLAHVNKHRDDDNNLVYSGVTDLVDDSDCAYMLDTVIEEKSTGIRTVKFTNFKQRGDVVNEALYRYDYADGTHYKRRLESVQEIGKEEQKVAEIQKRMNAKLECNQPAIDVIKDCLREKSWKKTELISEAAERSGLSKKLITKALSDHTGNNIEEYQFWHVNRQDKNAHVYQLNYALERAGSENWKTEETAQNMKSLKNWKNRAGEFDVFTGLAGRESA